MLPVLAIVGRPNVGKSTLFNRLTGTRDALVDDRPGVTRDRLYGRGKIGNKVYLVVDTGGLASDDEFFSFIEQQVERVLEEAQAVLFLVDRKQGIVSQDREILQQLRRTSIPIYLLVNKSEGVEANISTAEFQELAIDSTYAISAKRGDGVPTFLNNILEKLAESQIDDERQHIKFTIVGRPNVGKSTLTNKLVGEHRVIVSNIPGTTRDSVKIPLVISDQEVMLIDTAGVRKKSKVGEAIEKYSAIKTLRTIESCHVAILVLNAQQEITAQDAFIAGTIDDFGKSVVIVLNKWDGLKRHQRNSFLKHAKEKLDFLSYPEYIHTSALYGSNVKQVMIAAMRAYKSAIVDMKTSRLNKVLGEAVTRTPPPLHHNRTVRLKFAHQAGKNPPVVVVHGNQADSLPDSYRRFLSRFFARSYKLVGTPVYVIPRVPDNPFTNKNSEKSASKSRLRKNR